MTKSLEGLSFEELTALNDEIIMLSRAGVSMEAGLLRYARDGRGAANLSLIHI